MARDHERAVTNNVNMVRAEGAEQDKNARKARQVCS